MLMFVRQIRNHSGSISVRVITKIYHHLERRIEAHLCIAFAAYAIYKELERLLQPYSISPKRAIELTQTWYSIEYRLPQSGKDKKVMKMDENQRLLYGLIYKKYNNPDISHHISMV